ARSPTPAALFPLGATTVRLMVSDGRASSTDEISVTVADTSPPEVTLSTQPSVLWPPNGQMIDVEVMIRVADRCDPSPNFALVSISSNDVTARSDDVARAEFGTPDTQFLLRARRNGGGVRRYRIVYEGRDRSANTSIAESEASVPHDLGK
ncbi:hypothetical protein L0Y59_00490, partial [Candidatus Uhrbacteria bacterium]|nr:hypothetical protein [Candidatus Uhrbacteria bacterium]